MAYVRIPETDEKFAEQSEISKYLASVGIDYGVWDREYDVAEGASDEDILGAYKTEIETLKAEGGYVTADIINVVPETPGLDAMLEKFKREHWHDEDEVRFVIDGEGVFHINPGEGKPVVAIEVSAGDFIRVPEGTLHWFELCSSKKIKCIRLFQDPAGWAPHYTDSEKEKSFLEVCLGPSFIPQGRVQL